MSLRIAIVTDDPGWHGRRLRQAFAARGADSRYTSLAGAHIDLDGQPAVQLSGFGDALPDAVFVRGIPGGSLEQVVFHLNVLHALQDLGVVVYNSGRAIERSVDKSLTSLRLRQAGIASPPTWVTARRATAEAIVANELSAGNCLLCKPLFGSQGRGIVLVRTAADLPGETTVNGVWYLQRFIGRLTDEASDWRVFVIGGRAVAAMRRTARGWMANVAQGGVCQAVLPDGHLRQLAEDAVACLQMEYAGVDIMRDPDGRWWLIEVNSIPAWKGLQGVCQADIAGSLADDVLMHCRKPRRRVVLT